MKEYKNLEELWKHVREVNDVHFSGSYLMPIFGNGKTQKPKFMFLFINPTIRNISSDKSWNEFRAPFIGTKQIWRVFHKADLFDDSLIQEINSNSIWSYDLSKRVYAFLSKEDFYFTNLVKWTGKDSSLPDKDKINLFLPILKKEIELVKPKYIITFGLLPFESLIGKKIKLETYFKKVINSKELDFYELTVNGFSTKVIPCYFPVGRGNPQKAIEILKMLKNV